MRGEIDLSSPATTEVVRQQVAVHFDYDVVFTRHCLDPENPALAQAMRDEAAATRPRCVAFVDLGLVESNPGVVEAIIGYFERGDTPQLAAPPVILPGGETIKNEAHYIGRMHDAILDNGIDRHSYVLAVGGGALLDAVGLAASTAHRGVRLVRAPTTVLSQNDGGVGVKTALNRNGVKNQIGTFAPPRAVIIDPAFLETLPAREKVAGMAEAVKVALIRDAPFFCWLERSADALATFEPDAMDEMVRRCAMLHMRQIAQGGDPFEQGNARPLDFGHWAAHKIETLTRNHVRHGEAVAIGIALDTRYSVLTGLLPEGEDARIAALLELLGFKLWHPVLEARAADGANPLLQGIREFREHLGGELTITLLEGIGRGIEVHRMDEAIIAEAISWLKARQIAS